MVVGRQGGSSGTVIIFFFNRNRVPDKHGRGGTDCLRRYGAVMSEADVKRAIVKAFKDRGHYARRIEDSFSVGFPDLILIPQGYPVFFTEVKIVKGLKFGPSPRQYVEMDRLAISKHSVPTLLGWDDGVLLISKHREEVRVIDCVAQQPDENVVDLFKRFYHERVEI